MKELKFVDIHFIQQNENDSKPINFSDCFSQCSSLTSIPDRLYKNITDGLRNNITYSEYFAKNINGLSGTPGLSGTSAYSEYIAKNIARLAE
jgi:hypothetical protein